MAVSPYPVRAIDMCDEDNMTVKQGNESELHVELVRQSAKKILEKEDVLSLYMRFHQEEKIDFQIKMNGAPSSPSLFKKNFTFYPDIVADFVDRTNGKKKAGWFDKDGAKGYPTRTYIVECETNPRVILRNTLKCEALKLFKQERDYTVKGGAQRFTLVLACLENKIPEEIDPFDVAWGF